MDRDVAAIMSATTISSKTLDTRKSPWGLQWKTHVPLTPRIGPASASTPSGRKSAPAAPRCPASAAGSLMVDKTKITDLAIAYEYAMHWRLREPAFRSRSASAATGPRSGHRRSAATYPRHPSWGGRPAFFPATIPIAQRWRPQYPRKLPCRSAAVISAVGHLRTNRSLCEPAATRLADSPSRDSLPRSIRGRSQMLPLEFITGLGSAAACPVAADAQSRGPLRVIGYLRVGALHATFRRERHADLAMRHNRSQATQERGEVDHTL
jgi:hypothetical protein